MGKKLLTIILAAVTSLTASAQQWSVSTNVLDYINFGTLNAEGSVAVARHLVVDVGLKFNPWTFGNKSSDPQKTNRQRMYYAGVKVYPWYIYDGWHFDAMAAYKEYNSGGILKQETEEGDAFGAAVGAGYTLPVHKNLNLEFGAMLWGGYKTYIVYSCPTCGRKLDSGSKFFLMPTNITFGVTWVFGKNKYQEELRKKREESRKNYVEK